MTAGRILTGMANPALDRDGNPYSKAKLYFYQSGTTIAENTYTDATLGTALTNPVVSDGAGRFPAIWGDITIPYSVRWTDANDALIYTFDDIFPFGPCIGPDGEGIDPANFGAALGLGTAALENIGASGANVPLCNADTTIAGDWDFTGGFTKDGDDVGTNRVPLVAKDLDRTFTLADVGTGCTHDGGVAHAWTIPPQSDVAWLNGQCIYLRNTGTGVITVMRGSGVTLRIAGSGTDQDVDMAQWACAVLMNEDAADTWVIIGNGLS